MSGYLRSIAGRQGEGTWRRVLEAGDRLGSEAASLVGLPAW